MNVVNTTRVTLWFKYGDKEVSLKPGESMAIDLFDLDKLVDVRKLEAEGFLTLVDTEDDEPPFDFDFNVARARNAIVEEGDMLDNVNFNAEIDDF
jgi:hypothetical protein